MDPNRPRRAKLWMNKNDLNENENVKHAILAKRRRDEKRQKLEELLAQNEALRRVEEEYEGVLVAIRILVEAGVVAEQAQVQQDQDQVPMEEDERDQPEQVGNGADQVVPDVD